MTNACMFKCERTKYNWADHSIASCETRLCPRGYQNTFQVKPLMHMSFVVLVFKCVQHLIWNV